ncbi:MAG: dTDP-4-dehydrorhamnose 3,5-epimerase family protein [Gallionella sp.]|nr:dTDP-4-dehydrorhamnose 3,5-epimerase family protein [Gallionella sp.]
MNTIPTDIPSSPVVAPKMFGATRGFFCKSFNAKRFAELTGITFHFIQDNRSKSARHVLCGLHYQIKQAQGKLVSAVQGRFATRHLLND